MGLDLSVVRTKADIDLRILYLLKDVVEENFDWYLGTDANLKQDKYNELVIKACRLTKYDIMKSFKEATGDAYSTLEGVPDEDFTKYLNCLSNSIGKFNSSNTHLFFDYGKFPEISLLDSCSWTLLDIIKSNGEYDDESYQYVVKLDISKLKTTLKKWNGLKWKMIVAKWVGYFNLEAGLRISDDIAYELRLDEPCNDVNYLIYSHDCLKKIMRDFNENSNESLWLVYSY